MKKSLVLLFAAALFSLTAPAALLIDNFDNGAQSVNSTGVLDASTLDGVLGVLDGTRIITALCTAGSQACSTTRNVAVEVDPSALPDGEGFVSIGSAVSGSAQFAYFGPGSIGLNGGIGYTLSPNGSFLIDITFFDAGQGPQAGTQARVYTLSSTGIHFVEKDVLSEFPPSLAFPMSAFTAQGADPTTVIGLILEITNGSQAPDLGLDNFRYSDVPEPGTYAMLGAGLVGLALLRRRTAK
jgi:hypothetical protein